MKKSIVPITGILASTVALAGGPAAPAAEAALPSVDHARVVVAAQVEPVCGDQSAKLGDNASTKLVQSALISKGISTSADGWFGNGTTNAYKKWQGKLGYSGLAANGLPGKTSLTKLGANRFTLSHVVNVGNTRDSYGGKRVNTRTKNMLQAADNMVAWSIPITQGSYNPGGVGASAGTHDGGGAVDISVRNMTTTQRWKTVQALRKVGFAAWLRGNGDGLSPHIHAMAIGDPDMAGPVGRDQICDYLRGRNGLRGHAADNTPTQYRVAFTWWEKYKGI